MRDLKLKAKTSKERYEWYKSRGICVKCGRTWCEPGHTTCKACYAKETACHRRADPDGSLHAAKCKARRQARIEAGICTECGREPATEGLRMCPKCREMRNDSTRKYKMQRRIARKNEEQRLKLIEEGKRIWGK